MENVIVPGWVWGLFSVVIVAWLVRLTFMAFKSERDATVAENKDKTILDDLNRLEDKIDETKKDINVSLDKFDVKFEKFEEKIQKKFDQQFELIKLATKS